MSRRIPEPRKIRRERYEQMSIAKVTYETLQHIYLHFEKREEMPHMLADLLVAQRRYYELKDLVDQGRIFSWCRY
jgi:hypothetical protein